MLVKPRCTDKASGLQPMEFLKGLIRGAGGGVQTSIDSNMTIEVVVQGLQFGIQGFK